jgi:hypothetical protein
MRRHWPRRAVLGPEIDGIISAAFLIVIVEGTDYFVTKAMAKKGIVAR